MSIRHPVTPSIRIALSVVLSFLSLSFNQTAGHQPGQKARQLHWHSTVAVQLQHMLSLTEQVHKCTSAELQFEHPTRVPSMLIKGNIETCQFHRMKHGFTESLNNAANVAQLHLDGLVIHCARMSG